MRTKTLLIAAAALVAGIISSNAQVYSANVVGYVNVVSPAGTPTLICNPLDLDGVDNITNVLASVPKGTSVQLWNGSGYTSVGRASLGAGAWSANAANAFIPPGVGFFINTPSTFTNTFVGNVSPGEGGTTNLQLTANVIQLVGSVLPVSGTITNAADQGTNGLNLAYLPKGTSIQLWNGSGYTSVGRASLGAGLWNTNPVISVGVGFFIKSPVSTNWTQTLQN